MAPPGSARKPSARRLLESRSEAPPPRRPNLPFQSPPGTWDRERCLEAIRAWAKRYGTAPRAYEWSPGHGRAAGLLPADRLVEWERSHPRWPSAGTVREHCGSWRSALRAAGVVDAGAREPELAFRDRVAAAQRLRSEGLRVSAIADLLEIHRRTVQAYLGAESCPDCGGPRVTAGAERCADCARRRPWTRFERGAYLSALKTWVAETGAQPSWKECSPSFTASQEKWRREYPRFPPASAATTLFGSWRAALEAAGLRPQQRRWQADEIVRAIQTWAQPHGKPPSWEEWRRSSEHHPSAATVTRQLGCWPAALAAAGLRAHVLRRARWDRAAILAAVHRFQGEHGRPPRTADFAVSDERLPDPGTVRRYFGSWDRALAAAQPDPSSAR